jgi:hypothetical protein
LSALASIINPLFLFFRDLIFNYTSMLAGVAKIIGFSKPPLVIGRAMLPSRNHHRVISPTDRPKN